MCSATRVQAHALEARWLRTCRTAPARRKCNSMFLTTVFPYVAAHLHTHKYKFQQTMQKRTPSKGPPGQPLDRKVLQFGKPLALPWDQGIIIRRRSRQRKTARPAARCNTAAHSHGWRSGNTSSKSRRAPKYSAPCRSCSGSSALGPAGRPAHADGTLVSWIKAVLRCLLLWRRAHVPVPGRCQGTQGSTGRLASPAKIRAGWRGAHQSKLVPSPVTQACP